MQTCPLCPLCVEQCKRHSCAPGLSVLVTSSSSGNSSSGKSRARLAQKLNLCQVFFWGGQQCRPSWPSWPPTKRAHKVHYTGHKMINVHFMLIIFGVCSRKNHDHKRRHKSCLPIKRRVQAGEGGKDDRVYTGMSIKWSSAQAHKNDRQQ